MTEYIGVELQMNRFTRRRAEALARKSKLQQTGGVQHPSRTTSAQTTSTLPTWRMALLGSAAIGAMAVSGDIVHAQTAGADNEPALSVSDGDNIDFLAGNDTITFANTIGVNAGVTVSGGADDDTIDLQSVNVGDNAGSSGLVLGDTGNDTINVRGSGVGRYGVGTLSGGDGNDSIFVSLSDVGSGTTGSGSIQGDAGQDTISLDTNAFIGATGAGTVSGGADDDVIRSASANGATGDIVIGANAGSSGVINGDGGNDSISLLSTADFFYVGRSGEATISGGDGNDTIELTRVSIAYQGTASGVVLGDAGDDSISISGGTGLTNIGRIGDATVDGGIGNDTITIGSGTFIGRFAGSSGQILGGDGVDSITLNETRVGNSGDGTVSGGAGNDLIALSNSTVIGTELGRASSGRCWQ